MPALSSHPVEHRGRRVENLQRRERSDGTFVYEFAGRLNGKPTRRKLKATTAGDAVAEIRRLLALDKRKVVGAPPLSETVDAYLAYLDTFAKAGEMAASTITVYEPRLRRFAKSVGHRKRVSDVTTGDVQALLAELRRDGLASGTRNGYLIALRSFFRYCMEHDPPLVERSPVDSLPRRERPSGKRATQPRRLSPAQCEALFSELGDQFGPLVQVIAYQGFRVSEALGLRWRDVDLAARTLDVCGQLGRDGERTDRLKTPSSRGVVPMFPMTLVAIRAWKAKQAELDLNLVKPQALVFSTLTGKPQSRYNVRRAIRNAAAKAGLHSDPTLPKVTTKDLRGSAGSIALAHGATLAQVSEYLRHASTHVTAVSYADVIESERGATLVAQIASAGWGAA